MMISEAKAAEVAAMVNDGFSHHWISKRTGVSRPTIAAVAKRMKKGLPLTRQDTRRNEYKHKFRGTPEDFRKIQDEAWEALQKAGRDKGEHAIGEIKRETAF